MNSLAALLTTRWVEACRIFPSLGRITPTWEVGHSAHFASSRGYATTKTDGTTFHLTFAQRALSTPIERLDAIIRHEIGHIVDFSRVPVPTGLPSTRERRADAIAEFIWGQPIRYDTELVQTLGPGITPRPEELGL